MNDGTSASLSLSAARHLDHGRAPYWFSAFPFPPGHFTVHSVRGHEAISKPYVFDVTVTANTLIGDNIEQLAVGHRASLVIRVSAKPRVFAGVIESVRAEGLRQSGKVVQTTFRLVPLVALLKHRFDSRIFQDMRVDQVIDRVLHEAGIPTRWNLTKKHPVRDYITQYEESDLAFVQRLIAEAGIFYTFGCATSTVGGLLSAMGVSLPRFRGQLLQAAFFADCNLNSNSTGLILSILE